MGREPIHRDRLFERYATTHVQPREGVITTDSFRRRVPEWDWTFSSLLPADRGAKIIDVGCGSGSIVWWLQQKGFTDVTGVDISAEMIEAGLRAGVRNLVREDIREFLSRRSDEFDAIVARDVLEHFPKEQVVQLVEACFQALKPGGKLVVQVPNAESPFGSRIRYADFTHELAFTSSSLAQILRIAGFCDFEFYSVPPPLTNALNAIRFALWKVIEAVFRLLLLIESGRGARIVTQNLIAVATKPSPR